MGACRDDMVEGNWPKSIVRVSRGRRGAVWLVIVAAVAAIAILDRQLSPSAAQGEGVEEDIARYHGRTFRVVRVLDGDTFDIDIADGDYPDTRIRLWGVDTPETSGEKGPMHFGPEAAEFAKATLEGTTVYLELSPEKTRGKYGRLLAYVYPARGEEMFNEDLVAHGYAYADRRFRHHFRSRFETLERRAKRQNVGLWKDVVREEMPNWYRRIVLNESLDEEEQQITSVGKGLDE